jgi:hypothetical protein
MLNMITTWGSCSQSLCVCRWPNLYTTLSTQSLFFCTSQQFFQQKALCAQIQQPYSTTLLPLIQAHVYDLFVKGTLQPIRCSLNTHWHYFIWVKIPCLKGIHFKEFFCSQLTIDNDNLLNLQFSLHFLGQTKEHRLQFNMKVPSQIFSHVDKSVMNISYKHYRHKWNA